MTNKTLLLLYKLYDKFAFGKQIRTELENTESTFVLKFTERKTKTIAGKCSKKGCTYTLSMFRHIFDGVENSIVGGIKCKDELDCFLITFEHELVHLMLVLGLYPPDDSHGKNFKFFVKHIFAHTSTVNALGIDIPEEDTAITKNDLKLGDIVSFKSNTKYIRGKILKLNPKRAVVRSDDDNASYTIPYELLHRVPQKKSTSRSDEERGARGGGIHT